MKTPRHHAFISTVTKVLAVLTCIMAWAGSIQAAGERKPTGQEQASDGSRMIDLPAQAKLDTVLAYVSALRRRISNDDFSAIRIKCEDLFSASGYVSVETAEGLVLRLTRSEFLMRAREMHRSYLLQQSTLLLNDQFRQDETNRWFCRSTTFHAVSRFDRGAPVPEKITSVQRKPMLQKAPTESESYWQIVMLSFKEI